MSRIKAGREGQFCVTGRFVRNISGRTDEPAIGSAQKTLQYLIIQLNTKKNHGFAPIFPDICYHLTHYKPAAADIPVASDNPAHYADA
ncbi:hypothetical protein ACTFVY_21050, partial [Escherichia coli]